MIHFLNLFASLVTTTKMRIKWPHFFVLVVLLFVVHWSSHQALILLQCWNRNFLLLFLGTAKYNLSQVKWASQVALQWLPDTDVFPTFHTAAHHPAAVPAAQKAAGGEFKDLVTFLVFWMFQIPVAWSIRPWDRLIGLWGQGQGQGFGRKTDWCLVMADWQPNGENSSQPVGWCARRDPLLQNALLSINLVPPRQISPSENFPTDPIVNHSWFGYVLSVIIRYLVRGTVAVINIHSREEMVLCD